MFGVLGAIALLAVGCGTATRSGLLGDTLSTGSLHVTVQRVDLHPPIPKDDVTGLSRPAPGERLVGVRVRVCSGIGPAIGSWDFGISVDGGGPSTVNNAQTNYVNGFDSLRLGCSRGWVVFQIPQASRPTAIRFAFDDTGDAAGAAPHRGETHARFSWTLS
jgi:hypothetical protein